MHYHIDTIQQKLTQASCAWIHKIEVFDTLPSSNDYLLSKVENPYGQVCITEHQSKGRGRRGNAWLSSKAKNLMFSLAWSPTNGELKRSMAPLSLVVGVAIMDALKLYKINSLGLKWPNDILVDEAKLGGILIDSSIQANQFSAIIGVGLNLCNEATEMQGLASKWTDLAQCGIRNVDRNTLIANCLIAISQRLESFERHGFEAIRNDWSAYHAFEGCEVAYQQQKQNSNIEKQSGRIVGVNQEGALLINTAQKIIALNAGEIHTIRPT